MFTLRAEVKILMSYTKDIILFNKKKYLLHDINKIEQPGRTWFNYRLLYTPQCGFKTF